MDMWQKLEMRRQAPAPPPPRGAAQGGEATLFEQLKFGLRGPKDTVKLDELSRIMTMPRNDPTLSLWDGSSHRKKDGLTLRPVQQQALAALEVGGGLFPIGVGHGKTYIAILAGCVMQADLVIILAPPRTTDQMWASFARADNHFKLPRVEIVPYSSLSLAKSTDLLWRLVAGFDPAKVVLVADEAHNIKRFSAARTKRVARFLDAHPAVRFVAMSGTLTSKSLKDFSHLAQWALRDGSPVPSPNSAALDHWSACLDSKGKAESVDWTWCEGLWQWAGCAPKLILQADPAVRKEQIRRAFHERLSTTQGVVCTQESSCDASLYLDKIGHKALGLPENIFSLLAQLMTDVRESRCTPDGQPIESAVDQWRILRQLSLGFYYEWVWPNGEVDWDWKNARSEWHKQVRNKLDHESRDGYDSPLLVYNQTAKEHKAGARKALHLAWAAWQVVKDRPVPPTQAVWVTTGVLDAALAFVLKDKTPWIVWYSDRAVADALETRMTVIRAGQTVPIGPQTLALSEKSHGEGLNLQAWSKMLVLNPNPTGKVWEQLIGRIHRPFQEADEVCVSVLAHTLASKEALSSAFRDASYLQHTTGQQQKLLLAQVSDSK